MYKKVCIDQDRDFPIDKMGVKESDGPDYPLFEFKGFGSRPVKELKKTPTKNGSRKSALIQEKLDSLIASTTGFHSIDNHLKKPQLSMFKKMIPYNNLLLRFIYLIKPSCIKYNVYFC